MPIELHGTGLWSRELRYHEDRAALAEAATELEGLGYSGLFIPGGSGGDVLGAAGDLLEATTSVPVATGILNVWMHDPAEVAAERARLDADHPDRFLLGLGISHAPLVDREEPGLYRKPLSKMRAYLDELDAADPPVPPEGRMLAALGPKMLALAGQRAVGAHPYFVPVDHTRAARDLLGEGPLIATEQAVALETDPARARAMAREHMERYLELPNYTNNLLRHGFEESDLAGGGSDRLVDAIVAWGDEERIAERVAEHRAAGADHVCLQVVGVPDGALPLEVWRSLAPAVTG